MEQEHDLAEHYFNAYFEAVQRDARPAEGPQAEAAVSYLLQACGIWKQHFKTEEEIIAALEDRSNAFGF